MTGDTLTPAIDLSVTYPHLSPRGNNLLYLTHVTAGPQVPTHVHARRCRCATCIHHTCPFFALQVVCQVNPQEVHPDIASSNPLKETLSDFLLVSQLIEGSSVFSGFRPP